VLEEDSDVEEPELNSDLEFDADWGFKDVPLGSGTSWSIGSLMGALYILCIACYII
jgi:hypothetical protein